MRWFNVAVISIFVIATLIFAAENFQSVTVSFLSYRISLPLAILVPVIYLLGMVTGGCVWALIRRALEGSKKTT